MLRDIILDCEDVIQFTVIGFRPDVRVGRPVEPNGGQSVLEQLHAICDIWVYSLHTGTLMQGQGFRDNYDNTSRSS